MAGLSALLAACDGTSVRRVAIVAQYVPACAPEGAGPEQLELIALGDFDRSNDSVSILASDASLQTLTLPSDTRAAELSTLADRRFWGMGELDTHNQIPILLWPREQACPLAQLPAPDPAGDDGRWSLGLSSRASRVLVLGADGDGESTALAVSLADASVEELSSTELGALPKHASISELGSGLLVAGGEDVETGVPGADGWLLRFEQARTSVEPRRLAVARSRHAALSLPSGSTLLIGGQSERGEPLASVEIIAPEERGARVLDLLETPRLEPVALLLDGGRLLVGGGYTWSDASGPRARSPVASVEFSSIDLAEIGAEPVALEPAALDRAFVQLAGGAALAAGGCEPGGQSDDCIPCEGGSGCVSRSAWWIDPQGGAHPLAPLPAALASARPALVAAAEGAPWLIADEALGRFDPWRARFDVVATTASAPNLGLLSSPKALGPGSFVWLSRSDTQVELLGLHHSLRSRFTQDVAPLLVGSGRGVLPLRPPTEEPSSDTTLRYRVAAGLELAGSAAVASIADTDYADFTLELTLRAGPPPLLRLVAAGDSDADDGTSFGGLECPWPDPPASSGSPVRLGVRRAGDDVRLRIDAGTSGSSEAPAALPCRRALPERVAIQLVGTRSGTTELSRIEIRRSVD